MSHLISLLTAMWMSSVAAQLGSLTTLTKGIAGGATKELAAIADPIEKTLVFVGSSQCKTVKKILGVDYDSYNGDEPDLSKLSLDFITRKVNVTYSLSDAANLIPQSRWFNFRQPLKIYMHGFTDDPTKDSYKNISNAFLSQGDFNIVALDASSLIRWLYLRSTTMVRFIGEELGHVLAALVNAGFEPSDIHLIGHSLGAHISGFAGKTFFNLTYGIRVGRISGLDPAGPCFSDVNETLRLHVNDANFVDVMHTDAGVYGLDERIGHADFYPNSGSQQPTCLFQTCSHSRAWLLFAESVINPQAFMAASCANWTTFRDGKCNYSDKSLMGFGCEPDTRGTYYLQTAEEIPYGLGPHGLRFVNNEGLVRNALTQLG